MQSLSVFVLLVDKSGEWRTLFETAVASTYANTTLVFLHSVLQWATTPCCAVLSAHHICWCTSQCPTTTLTVLLCWVLPRCATQLQPHLFSQQQNPLVSESWHRDTAVRTGDFYFICSNIYFFKKVKTTVKKEPTSGFPDIAMIAADKTRHGSIPVIGVSGREKNANSESQDSCSLSRNIHLVILRCQG